jgi:hypothetical protein
MVSLDPKFNCAQLSIPASSLALLGLRHTAHLKLGVRGVGYALTLAEIAPSFSFNTDTLYWTKIWIYAINAIFQVVQENMYLRNRFFQIIKD